MYRYIIILITVLLSLHGNTQLDSLSFSVSSYYSNNQLHKIDTITIKNSNQKLDVHFYKEHFYQFYGLPKKIIKKKYKSQEIVEWSNPKNKIANWSDSYTYDAKGRLIEYNYSGCMVCSQFPWGYTLTYDHNDNIIEQRTYFLSFSHTYEEGEIKTNFKLSEEYKDYTKLTYNTDGSIILLEKYGVQGIEKRIERILIN